MQDISSKITGSMLRSSLQVGNICSNKITRFKFFANKFDKKDNYNIFFVFFFFNKKRVQRIVSYPHKKVPKNLYCFCSGRHFGDNQACLVIWEIFISSTQSAAVIRPMMQHTRMWLKPRVSFSFRSTILREWTSQWSSPR